MVSKRQAEAKQVEFFKLHGCGNDFVFFDNRKLLLPKEKMSNWAQAICRRTTGIGADGVVFLESTTIQGADYSWHFYNADGSRAEMCGNGVRCAGVLAIKLGLAGNNQVLHTDAGVVYIKVDETLHQATVTMMSPEFLMLDIPLHIEGKLLKIHSVTLGVPHVVIIIDHLYEYDVVTIGKIIRYHEQFSPAGTNVNFIEIESPNSIRIRTYERGVENETLACGSGICSAVFIGNILKLLESNVNVITASGESIRIILEDGKILMKGPAVHTFTGYLDIHQLGLTYS